MNSLKCLYCELSVQDDNYLHCIQCNGDVHIHCLHHNGTPGDLFGDVFFHFTCVNCHRAELSNIETKSQKSAAVFTKGELNTSLVHEKFVRQHLPWVIVITLTIYNLSIKSKGLSNRGYFHWRTHIVSFIEKNWDYLFDPAIKKRKNWIGSVSGTLSHNSPTYFTSGQEVFHDTGWWKLTHSNKTPKLIYDMYKKQYLKRQQGHFESRSSDDDLQFNNVDNKRLKYTKSIENDDDSDIIMTESCSRLIPYMGRPPKIKSTVSGNNNKSSSGLACKSVQMSSDAPISSTSMPLNTVQSHLMDFLAENLNSDSLSMLDTLPSIVPDVLVDVPNKAEVLPSFQHENDLLESISDVKSKNVDINDHLYGQLQTEVSSLDDTLSGAEMTQISMFAAMEFQCKPTENFTNTLSTITTSATTNNRNKHCFQGDDFNKTNSVSTDNNINSNGKSSSSGSCSSSDEFVTSSHEDNCLSITTSDNDNKDFQPRIVQVINFQETSKKDNKQVSEIAKDTVNSLGLNAIENSEGNLHIADVLEQNDTIEDGVMTTSSYPKDIIDDSDQISELLANLKPSLFNKCPPRNWTWMTENSSDEYEADIKCTAETVDGKSNKAGETKELTLMSKYEEKELLQKFRKVMSLEKKCQLHIPAVIRRFYRKLYLREWKRQHGKPIFNLDGFCNRYKFVNCQSTDDHTEIIDRFQLIAASNYRSKRSFHARIAGAFDYERFQSPYTKRILHPFIYRNSKTMPAFLQVMCELKYKINGIPPSRGHIDYCYVRPNHIAAVNALLQTLFWPGIDMSECLTYPDYSVVALYKKLVIGCGFLVPDVGFNEAYISFMAVRPGWQRSGIATFMLYHLIQTCMTKDITLHVSATNPAVVLYQKFGFKIEEVILNFYDKYLPFDSKHSRNALFLRLIR